MPLGISQSKIDSVALLLLKGTMVAGKDTELLTGAVSELLEAGQSQIVLDMGQVNYIDSTGIGALVRSYNLAMAKGAAVKLLHLTKRIHDVLQITRLSTVFEIYDDPQKALASFAPPSQEKPVGGIAP
jgi:anti-sigma B factor antagonist